MLGTQSSSRYNGFGLSPQTHHSNWHLNVASIQFFKRKITQPPVHSHRSTGSPVHSYQSTVISHQFTSLPVLDSQLTTKPLHYYTTIRLHQFTSHHSLLISALGLIKFSIQWLWSISHQSSVASSPVYQFTSLPVHQFSTHLSPLTTHYYTTTPLY